MASVESFQNKVIGFDPSLRNTAYVYFEKGEMKSSGIFKTKKRKEDGDGDKTNEKKNTSSVELCQRMRDLNYVYKNAIRTLIMFNPDLIVMEGYSFGSRTNLTKQGEITGIIGLACIQFIERRKDLKIVMIPPTSVKKYITGKGNAKKELILKEVYRIFDFDTDDNNIADAFVIAKIGSDYMYYITNNKFPEGTKKYQEEVFKNLNFFKV